MHIISFVFMHQSFVTPPQLRGMLRTLTLCLQFPIVTTILRGQLAGKTMTVLPRSLFLYCTAMFVYVCQTPTFPPHCGDNVQVKHSTLYPILLRGLGEAVVTNAGALFIAYDTLRMNIKFSATPKTSAGILFNLFPSTFPPHH